MSDIQERDQLRQQLERVCDMLERLEYLKTEIEGDLAALDSADDASPPPAEVADSSPGSSDLEAYVESDLFRSKSSAVDRFLALLGFLAGVHGERFQVVEEIRGSSLLYFSTQKEEIEAAGSTTQARLIPETNMYVATNQGTARKVSILSQVLEKLGEDPRYAECVRSSLALARVKRGA